MELKYKLITLKNKAKILLIPLPTVKSVEISADINTGSATEASAKRGITHFVEHMALAATKSWNTKEKLSVALEQNAASSNGGTGFESLYYTIHLPSNKIDFGLKFIYEVLYESCFHTQDIETERNVILNEISRSVDDVYFQLADFKLKNILEVGEGYYEDIAGYLPTVSKLTKEELFDYYKKIHSPNNLFITVTGNFNMNEVKKTLTNLIEKRKQTLPDTVFPTENIKNKIEASKKSKKTSLVLQSIILNDQGYEEMTHKSQILNTLALRILSNSSTSRLYTRLREKEGLLYHIGTHVSVKLKFGYKTIRFECNPAIAQKTLEIVKDELQTFHKKGVTLKELNHHRESLINRSLLITDDLYKYARDIIANPLLLNKEVIQLEEGIKMIREIKVDEINEHIKQYFNPENASYIKYGNIKD